LYKHHIERAAQVLAATQFCMRNFFYTEPQSKGFTRVVKLFSD